MKRTSDFRNKEVINVDDGKRLGFVCDVEVNLEQGKIDSIVIPAPLHITNFFAQNKDYVIPWENIRKIGDDIILVDYHLPDRR